MDARQIDSLDSFSADTRRQALASLVGMGDFPDPGGNFNMHCHSFFSYNAEGWSPTRVAYESRRQGLYAAGLCDFDVLDGLEEFLAAGRVLSLRAAVHLETRAFVRELAQSDISSPGEPGVTYIMGCGFTCPPPAGSAQERTLAQLRQGAQERNQALIARINQALPEIALDYEKDVRPLTPRGVATERHIVRAYRLRALEALPDAAMRAAFWAPLLKCEPLAWPALEADTAALEERIRNALAKQGGLGYSQPDETTFPPCETFTTWVRDCGAIPTVAWLDGTTQGEKECQNLLDLMCAKGCAAVNIIPERNWNLKRPEEAALKRARLHEMVSACQQRGLPLNIGTEMNKGGLPFVDLLEGEVLSQYADLFTQGARIMIGQSLLGRYAAAPYLGARAEAEFPRIDRRNAFYAAIGALPPLDETRAAQLLEMGPERAFATLADAAARE